MSKRKLKSRRHKRLRVVVQLFLIVIMLLSSFSTALVSAEGTNSNDIRIGMINLGKGKQDGVGTGLGLETLTGEQLKTLGVFVSNYYVPFSTQVGAGRTEEETEQVKQQMVEALTVTGNFTDDVATSIVEAVLTVSSDPKPLYFGYSTDGGKKYNPAKTNGKKGRQATFYEFLDQVSGYAQKGGYHLLGNPKPYPDMDDYLEMDKDKRFSVYNDPNWGYKTDSNNRGALYWDEAGGGTAKDSQVVFDWIPDSNYKGVGQTASQTIMSTIYKYLDVENSVGTAFLDYTEKERGGATSSQVTSFITKKKLQSKSIEEIYKRSMYDWTMWVDAFGNISVDTGERQYVVVPASMNPYAFQKTESSDSEELEFGRAVPVNNLISITLASQGKLIDSEEAPTADEAKFNIGSIYSSFPDSVDSKSEAKAFYKFPGGGETYWNEATAKHDWGASILDALTTQFGMNTYGIDKPEDMTGKKWLNLGGKASEVERHKSRKALAGKGIHLHQLFTYGMNTAAESEHVVFAPRSGLNSTPKHYIIQDLVSFDQFGLLTNDDFLKEDITSNNTIKRTQIWNDKGEPAISTEGIMEQSAFGEKLVAERNKLNTASNKVMKDYSVNLYIAYVMAGLGGSDQVGFKLEFNRFPTYNGSTVLGDMEKYNEEQMQANTQELQNMAYYFLHPTEGLEYFSRWAKSKISAFLVGWHNDMTGANNATNSTGMTKYIGFSGFTTMPSLNDMEWTNWMVDTYLNWAVYLIIGVVILMLLYIVIGEVSIQKAVLGVGIFSLCLYLPPTAINSTVGITNAVSDAVYSNKFLHWGVSQLQSYSGKVDELAEQGASGDEVNYTHTLLGLQNGDSGLYEGNSSLGNGVTLKWMAPKKDNYLSTIKDEMSSATGGESNALAGLTDGLLRKQLSGETYLESNKAVYLYRTFSDITNYSRFYYGNLMGDTVYGNGTTSHDIGDVSESLSTVGMGAQYQNYLSGSEDSSLYDRKTKGFINDTTDSINGSSTNKKNVKRLYAPLSSTLVAKTANTDISKLGVGDSVGLSSEYLKATVKNFNNHKQDLKTQLKSDVASTELASTSSFALYTESPYYYFSWYLYDNGLGYKSGSSQTFRQMMLGENDSFFYNYKISKDSSGYGSLKDYNDMGSLFTTVIPYLRTLNSPMEQWSNIYSPEPYLDVSVNEEDASKYTDKDSEAYYKYWHNANLSRLYNTYTPWVDAMYDTNYAKPETIEYAGEKQVVQDPINPASYKVRPMVFSESEMEFYGLKEYNLTAVESKIIKVQKDTREDLLQLLNYSEFDDHVLNSASAMIMTFNFNKEFSQNNFFDESFVQYPQGFELKNFTYDAYLRLILSNGTGESLADTESTGNLYQRVVEKSSIFTGILLVIGDVLSVYVIPVMKFIFLVLVFTLSILTVFVKAMRIEVSFVKVLWTSLMKPLLLFCGVTVGHAVLISLFMTNGVTSVTGETSVTISLGDPAMTLIVIMLINAVVIALYSLIIVGLIKELRTYGRLAYGVVGGVLASSVSYAGSKAGQMAGSFGGSTGGTSRVPSSSSYSTDPEERGRNNVEPDKTVYSDLRTREINDRAYNEDSTRDRNDMSIDIEDTIEKGRNKVKDEHEDTGNFRNTESRPEVSGDAEEQRKIDDSSKGNAIEEMETKKKHAEDVKNKYNLD